MSNKNDDPNVILKSIKGLLWLVLLTLVTIVVLMAADRVENREVEVDLRIVPALVEPRGPMTA